MNFTTYFSKQRTPQSMAIPGTTQVMNSAGGYAWSVDDWARLDRFLVLGTEGGTYYIGEQKLTLENAQVIQQCIAADGQRVVARIVEISVAGRAPKNDPALFALAMCAGLGDEATRRAALAALSQVARIGTHLFHFLAYVELFRGWGRAMRRAVADWYNDMPTDRLAYQVIKYQQRDGWSHRDALRLAHPRATDAQRNAIYHWITQGWPSVGVEPHEDEVLRKLWAFERAKLATTEGEIIELIQRYDLPWETIPTQWLGSPAVWRSLLPKLPLTALLRNLARMTANGALSVGSTTMGQKLERWLRHNDRSLAADAMLPELLQRLTDQRQLAQARIHPIAVLSALHNYGRGHGVRGKLSWEPLTSIIDALDQAFYLSFGNVEATGKRIVLALDVSGSMASGEIAGVPGLTPRVASAAMAMVTAAVESQVTTVAFGHQMVQVNLSPRQRLDDIIKQTDRIPFGRTDCALPMIWAQENGVEADAFIVYTDSETWCGQIHPAQSLQEYRRRTGIAAKLIVVGMVSNGFSIADPNDGGMLDVVGFDAATPQLMADFIIGQE
ncbi:MAG: TROVE domain-containing protein [Caldilineaceae bacterium]|nr:TROVE domain-containing protein [Caldilineaceae bacterium]